MSAGIDYGRGLTNINPKTGIRYGIISQHEVLQVWADESEGVYSNPIDVREFYCPQCAEEYDPEKGDNWGDMVECPTCGVEIELSAPEDMEPLGFEYDGDGYKASQSYDDPDIFILESPFYTLCRFCSPCAPGAGSLMSPDPEGIKAYCFGHAWFAEGKAPYPIYDVKTGKEVEA